MESTDGIEGLTAWTRLLLSGARALPQAFGGKSCLRKFTRATRGLPYRERNDRGFLMTGVLGDSVDNRIVVNRDYEPGLSRFLSEQVSGADVFLDIGCNIGWFSCLAASLSKRPARLLALDANPAMVEACRLNLSINGFAGEAEVCALGPERGRITLHVPERRHSRASVGRANAAGFGATKEISVEMFPLAEILARFPGSRCDLIKMDIEGFELEALRAVPREVALNIGMIVMEYTRENLEGCGFAGMTLDVLPWLDAFEVGEVDDDGHFSAVAEPAGYSPKETTFVLRNRTWTKSSTR